MPWSMRLQKNGDIMLDCSEVVYCEFCLNTGFVTQMELFIMKFLNFDLDPKGTEMTSHAIDVEMRCPACGFHEVFGVAVSKEEYDRAIQTIKEPEISQN